MKRTTVTPEWMGEVRNRMKVNTMTSRDLAAARTLPPSTAAAAVRPAAKSSTSTSIGPLVRPTFLELGLSCQQLEQNIPALFTDTACGHVLRAKGFVQDENGWVELNATADGLTANAIPKGQEVLIVMEEGLEKERIEVRLKG